MLVSKFRCVEAEDLLLPYNIPQTKTAESVSQLDYGISDEGTGVQFLSGAEIFFFASMSMLALQAIQLPFQWVQGALPPGLNGPEHDIDHSLPCCAVIGNMWTYPTIKNQPLAPTPLESGKRIVLNRISNIETSGVVPPPPFMSSYVTKHRDSSTFNLQLWFEHFFLTVFWDVRWRWWSVG